MESVAEAAEPRGAEGTGAFDDDDDAELELGRSGDVPNRVTRRAPNVVGTQLLRLRSHRVVALFSVLLEYHAARGC